MSVSPFIPVLRFSTPVAGLRETFDRLIGFSVSGDPRALTLNRDRQSIINQMTAAGASEADIWRTLRPVFERSLQLAEEFPQ